MDEEIPVEEVTKFTGKDPFEKFYLFNTPDVPFGFFFVSQETCTLGWQGALNFFSLDVEALQRLPSFIAPGWILSNIKDTIKVSLILQAHELKRYDINQEEQYFQYKATIENPNQISFVRYDVQLISGLSSFRYSFTAENPDWQPTSSSELTILLPRSQGWSDDLVGWIIEHHISAQYFQQRIRQEALSKTIKNLSSF